MKLSMKAMLIWLIVTICTLVVGFSVFSKDLSIADAVADVRPNMNVRISRVVLNSANSSNYTALSYDYNVGSIMAAFQLSSVGSRITYEVDVTVYGGIEMAIKSITESTNDSSLRVSVTNYNMKSKLCDDNDSSKCTLNATKTMYVTIERISGNTTNYNVRLDFDFERVYNITYNSMTNTGYPSSILAGDDMTITFANNTTYNGTATYTYTGDTLTVTSYTTLTPASFVVTGNNTNSFSNNVLTISGVNDNISITMQVASTPNAAETILSLVENYSSTTTTIINLGNGTGSCTKTFIYDQTNDNNLRYIGSNPCNYVSFAGGTWRIIGVFNNITVVGESEPQTLLKLISTDNYNNATTVWNSSASNVWQTSSVYTALNGTYYTSTLGSSPYVANVMWNLSGSSTASYSTKQFYTAEHGSATATNGTTTASGYVGIMHVSDYGFATSGDMDDNTRSDCVDAALNSRDWGSDCYSYDWLDTDNTAWTIVPKSATTNYVYRFSYHVLNHSPVNSTSYKAYMKPVIFLKANVKIDSGDGSSGTGAYQLSQ